MLRTTRAALACALGALGLAPLTSPASAVPVTGYIYITWTTPMTSPNVLLGGVLSAWTCSQTTWPTTGPFSVTCTPPSTSTALWECDWLHAGSYTWSPTGQVRTTMLCDGVTAAQTATVSGVTGNDYVLALSGTTANNSITCTVDNGVKPVAGMATPDFAGFCGDPPSLGLLGR